MNNRVSPKILFHPNAEGKMGPMIRSFDWSKTELGSYESWPQSLKVHVSTMLTLHTPAIIFWGIDQIQIYNDGYSQIMGHRHPHYLGSTFKQCWPEAYDTIDPWMKRVTQNGEVVTVNQSLIPLTRNGFEEECYFTFNFSPLRDDKGKILGLLQIVTEVTNVVLTERRLEVLRKISYSSNFDRNITQNFIEAITSDPEDIPFALLYMPSITDHKLVLTGKVGLPVDQEFKIHQYDQLASELNHTFSTGELKEFTKDYFFQLKQKSIAISLCSIDQNSSKGVILFGISNRLHFDDKYKLFLKDIAQRLVMVMDVAEQELNRHQLAQEITARQLAEESLILRDEFISIASHELRTPLTALNMQIQLSARLLDELMTESPKVKEYATMVEKSKIQISKLIKLVENLLDVSRLNSGSLKIETKEVDLGELIYQVVKNLEGELQTAKCIVQFGLMTAIKGIWDPIRIEQVLVNLLTNACKYGAGKPVLISTQCIGESVVIEVKDQGIGIAKVDQERIFNRFERASSMKTYPGLGLGLYISKQIVNLHKGKIEVESELDIGSTFRVELPLS